MTTLASLHKLILFYSLTAVSLLVSVTPAHAVYSAENKKILVINSYHHGYKGSDDLVGGFSETLLKTFPKAELKVEYLDSIQYSGTEYDRKILDLIRFKYQHRHFDLILSTDDYAFNLLEKHRDSIFGATPVVFCGTNSFDPARLAGKQGFNGVDERPSFGETIELIFRLHPETREVVTIHDTSVTGERNSAEFRRQAAPFEKRAQFSFLAGLRLEELTQRVKKLPPGSVAIFFASFVEDRNGVRVATGDAQQIIAAASPVPIYGGWGFQLGKGIVGGRLINLREHGAVAALKAIKVLQSEPPGSLAKFTPSPNQFMFDYNEMSRFGIAESELPDGSIVINRPAGFLKSYKVALLSAISATLLLALIAIFMKLLKSRRELSASLQELQEAQSELLSTARKAGMAEIATNVLHNVGNVLNSVNISAEVLTRMARDSKSSGLSRTVKLLNQHSSELGDYLTRDEKGKLLPKYLEKLSEALAVEQQQILDELSQLGRSVDHIKDIVATQQSYAGAASIIEPVSIADLLEDALRITAQTLDHRQVAVVREFGEVPALPLDRARVLQILVNLVSNAKQAMDEMEGSERRLTLCAGISDDNRLRISVSDPGRGIAPENISRIFCHGFTTRSKGHGFGLHSCALAANEMGGTLAASSPGLGRGATFVLELPIERDVETHKVLQTQP